MRGDARGRVQYVGDPRGGMKTSLYDFRSRSKDVQTSPNRHCIQKDMSVFLLPDFYWIAFCQKDWAHRRFKIMLNHTCWCCWTVWVVGVNLHYGSGSKLQLQRICHHRWQQLPPALRLGAHRLFPHQNIIRWDVLLFLSPLLQCQRLV